MNKLTALMAALLLVAALGGCKTKKDNEVKPTATPATATVQPTDKTEPTPSPLLDTDKTIDDAKDKANEMADDVKGDMSEGMDKIENDLDTGANVDESVNP